MTAPAFDTGRVPTKHRAPNLFLSAFWTDATHFVRWRERPRRLALRATLRNHPVYRISLVLHFVDDPDDIAIDCVPRFRDRKAIGFELMPANVLAAIGALLGTSFGRQICNYEGINYLSPDEDRLYGYTVTVPPSGIRDVEVSIERPIHFPHLSAHELLGLANCPEIEFYRCPHAA